MVPYLLKMLWSSLLFAWQQVQTAELPATHILPLFTTTLGQEVQRFAVKQIKDHSSFSKSGIRFILFQQTKSQHSQFFLSSPSHTLYTQVIYSLQVKKPTHTLKKPYLCVCVCLCVCACACVLACVHAVCINNEVRCKVTSKNCHYSSLYLLGCHQLSFFVFYSCLEFWTHPQVQVSFLPVIIELVRLNSASGKQVAWQQSICCRHAHYTTMSGQFWSVQWPWSCPAAWMTCSAWHLAFFM